MWTSLLAPLLRTQPNKWACGPCALRHALLCYGVRASWRRLAALAGIDAHFDEDTTPGLWDAANAGGFGLGHQKVDTDDHAKMALRNYFDAGIPVLICVDREKDDPNHWIVAVSGTSKHVEILDSARPGPVLQRLTWRSFLGRACYYHPGEPRYDLYPLRDKRTRVNGRIVSDSEGP